MSGSMEFLPSDILSDILSRLPAETVLECKLVCRNWETVIRTHSTNMHLSRQLTCLYGGNTDITASEVEVSLYFARLLTSFYGVPQKVVYFGGNFGDGSFHEKFSFKEKLKRINHPPLDGYLEDTFVGSCNGLLCLNIRHHQTTSNFIYICNPVTREYVYLPELAVTVKEALLKQALLKHVLYGFGYISSTNEYKVVRIHYLYSYNNGYVEVYTLGSGRGWRDIGRMSYDLLRVALAGTYADGSIYWMEGERHVLAFDLADERFTLISCPVDIDDIGWGSEDYGLVALGGHLCIYLNTPSIKIWSLKKRGDESSSCRDTWSLDYVINYKGPAWTFEPILLLTNKEQIIIMVQENQLYCYDVKTSTLKWVSDKSMVKLGAIPHVNTFVSLKAMGEENSKRYMMGNTWENRHVLGKKKRKP